MARGSKWRQTPELAVRETEGEFASASSPTVRVAMRRCQIPRLLRREDGQSVVETAISAMGVLGLFFGVMEMSLALYTYHYVSEAARQATRYAMVRGSSCSGFTSACPAAASDIQNYVRGLDFPGIVPANVTVTTTWPTTGAACTPSSLPCNNPGNVVKVKVVYSFPVTIPFVPNSTLALSSTSQMVISQ
jgi:Flp pilus assembly protein TadG